MKLNYILIGLIATLMFAGSASAWYDTDWSNRIHIQINNTGNSAIEHYQFNVSLPGINASSVQVVNNSSSVVVPHWCENVTDGRCYELWFNASVGSDTYTYYAYYDNDAVSSTSNYSNTFTKRYNNTGLALELHMDEGSGNYYTNDTSGYANDATLIGMDVSGTSVSGWQNTDGGQWDNRSDIIFNDGAYLQYDGNNDFLNCDSSTSLNITGAHTINLWVKTNITSSEHGGLISKSSDNAKYFSSTANKAYEVGIYSGTLYYQISDGTQANYVSMDASILRDGRWHLLTCLWNGSTGTNNLQIYVDGNLEAHASSTLSSIQALNSVFDIGGYYAHNFNGSIDEVRIYNRALHSDEIYRQYIRSKYAIYTPVVTVVKPYLNITLYYAHPVPIYTNYTGVMTAKYIVESDSPLNLSSLAFLAGINNTVTDDMHSFIKVPANDIASEGIYRANFRNTTPTLLWEDNTTITNGNVWQWSGYDNNSPSITKNHINSTHTWVNVTGCTCISFPSMNYLDFTKMVTAPMTEVNINKHQGIILKVWDLERLRGRDNNYWINMYFDSALQATPDSDIDLWYCNSSFDPATDDPTTCAHCARMDTWNSTRWTDHRDIPFHPNSSYSNPLTVYAGQHPDTPPDVINYIYLTSETVTSKSYVLNATNYDPGVCNLTYAQTETIWLRDEVAGTNSPYAYTPSFYMTFVRDFTEFQYSLYLQNDMGIWGSNHSVAPIGISNVVPTHTKYNYFWWGNQTDYNMTGQYTEDFWVNLTYGYDPDNDAALTHVLSLYTAQGTFVSTINDTLTGNQTNEDIFFEVSTYLGRYQFKIVSTDNENTSTTTWSPVFELGAGTDEQVPLDLFIVLMVVMFVSLFYIYHAETYVAKIVTSMITTWLSFMLSGMIVSGTVVLNYAELSTVDVFVYGSQAIQVASLSHFFMFTGVVSTMFMLVFAVKLVIDTYEDTQEKNKTENEWDGVDEQ